MSNYTNLYGMPDALVNAVMNDPYTGGGDISATKLIDAPQRRVLSKNYHSLVVADVSERVYSLMGQAVHAILERAQTSALVEKRLYTDINGWSVSGQFDRLHLAGEVLQDWKVCSVYKATGDKSWERQLNILRYLAEKNGMTVNKLQVVAIFRDWKKSEAKRNPQYPQHNVMVIDVPLWTLDETEAYIKDRVVLHQRCEAGETVECSEEERWYSGTTYALMKDGGKRAKRVVPILSELGEIPPGHHVVERPGVNRRCVDYCEVAPFCQQYQRIKGNEPEGTASDDDDF